MFLLEAVDGLGINRVAGLPELLRPGHEPFLLRSPAKGFAASPVSWSVDAALARRRIALRVAGRGQPISAENTSTPRSIERTNEIGVLASCSGVRMKSLLEHPY
jgi:hypothetical protein